MKKLAVVLAIWLFLAPAAVFSLPRSNNTLKTTEASSTTDFGLYGEFATFYVGKGNATAMVLSSVGGSVEVPVNFSWEELDGLIALRIAGGVGHKWWLYYHHDIYPEIPPMRTLIMLYELPESQAVTKAKSLAQKIGAAVNVSFYPLWSHEEDGKTWILFTSEASLEDTANFIKDKILSMFPDDGLSVFADSPVIDDNLDKGIYTRAALTLLRDTEDFDGDNDTEEFAPVIVLATVIKDAIQKLDDGWYKLSIKEALQLSSDANISPRSISNVSIVKISHYLPLEIDESRTSPLPDNPMYEYSGKLIYVLKTENISKEYSDIVVYGKPFNYSEEREQAPLVTARFHIENVTSINNWGGFGHDALIIKYNIEIYNGGKGDAVDVVIGFEIKDKLKDMLDRMVSELGNVIGYNDLLKGPGWNYTTISAEGTPIYAFTCYVDNISANSSITLEFNLTVIPDIVGLRGIVEALNPHMGPLYFYKDKEGKQYFGFANGFVFAPDKVWTVGVLLIDSRNPINEHEFYYEYNFKVVLIGEGNTPLKNVVAKLYLSKPEGVFSLTEIHQVDVEYKNQIVPDENGAINREIPLSFEGRLRSGVWFVFASVEFDIDMDWGTVHLGFITNSYMAYIPPESWLIQKWIQNHVFPYKHVELNVNKISTYDNTTGELTIKLNITNIGDTNTTIQLFEFLLLDYIDTSAGNNGVVEFKVNGESKLSEIEVGKKDDLGVLVIVSPEIGVDVNQTVTVEIRVKIVVNYTGEFVVRPTLIHYIFGDYAPDQIDKEGDQARECGSRSRGEHEASEYAEEGTHSEGGKMKVLMEKSFTIMQAGTANALSTYTNSVVLVVTPQTGRKFPWGLIILLTLIVSIIVIAYVVVSKRKS